jgi:Mg-chelatase subunit ChlD
MLVLDHSTSMGDPGKMYQLRRGAFKFFVEAVRRHYAVGAVAFASKTQTLCAPSVDIPMFWRRLQRLSPYGRTRMARPLRVAQRRLRFRRGHRVIVLLTDGMPDDAEATLAAARFIRSAGITLIPIGTGQANEAFLATLAGRPELAYVTGVDDFSDAVANVAGRLEGRPG